MARDFAAASSEYLEIDSAVLTAYPFTVSLWFNVNDAATNYVPFYLGDKDSATDRFFITPRGASGDVLSFFAQEGGTNQHAETSNTFSADTWHHAVGIATDSTDRVAVLDGDWANRGTGSTDITPAGLDRTSIGRTGDSTPGAYIDGSIAEVAVWNVALSQAEVEILAHGLSPLLIRPASLAAYWPLMRDTDQDLVGGYDMTAYNTPTVAAHPGIVRYPVPNLPFLPAAGAPPATAAALLAMMGVG